MINFRLPIFLFLFCVFLDKSEIFCASDAKENTSNVCSSPECIFVADIIKQYMDPTVDPCDDFNQFVCGTFLKTTTLTKGQDRLDRYDIVKAQIQEQLKVILEEKTQPNEPRWSKLARNFYQSCTNTGAIEENGLRGALADLSTLGGWPVLQNSWNETKFEWKQSTYTLQKLGYGASYIFTFQVITDPSNSQKRILNIDQPPFSIGQEFLIKGLNDPTVNAYYNYMVDIAFLFGANKEKAASELKESLQFEINLATIGKSEENGINGAALNTRMTVKDLSQKYKSIPWNAYFNSIYSALNSNIIIGDDETILVSRPTFFDHFEKLINNATKRALANYQLWRSVQDNVDYLPQEFRQRKLKFRNMINGENKMEDRRQDCLDQILATLLKLSIGALYVRNHFSLASKKGAEKLAFDIENQFKKMIQEAQWMDETTRKNAYNRLASMNNFIGYPDEFSDDKILNEFYQKVTPEIPPNDYFKASSILSHFYYDYYYNKLRQPVNTSDWTLHGDSYISDPVYSSEGNGPEIPAGILRDVFYSLNALGYMNIAGIGSYNIGQLTTNRFSNLDAYMTPETKDKYLTNADCIAKQYGSYTDEEVGLKLNGSFTRTENINDNAGLRAANLAYREWAKCSGTEIKLPGLEKYSQSQLFWIHASIQQCAKYTPERLKTVIQTSILSPSGFRIIGTVSNRPEFAKDFNCSIDAKMNPPNKCSVW